MASWPHLVPSNAGRAVELCLRSTCSAAHSDPHAREGTSGLDVCKWLSAPDLEHWSCFATPMHWLGAGMACTLRHQITTILGQNLVPCTPCYSQLLTSSVSAGSRCSSRIPIGFDRSLAAGDMLTDQPIFLKCVLPYF